MRPTFLFMSVGLLVAACLPAAAQPTPQRASPSPWSLGFQIGATVNDFASDQIDFDYRVSWMLGALAEFRVADRLRLRSGVIYARKGAIQPREEGEDRLKADYIEFPLLVRLRTDLAERWGAGLIGGGQFSFNGFCEIEQKREDTTIFRDCSVAGADLRTLDYGVLVGAGIEFRPGPSGEWRFEVLYDLGLREAREGEDWKTRTIVIGVAAFLGQGERRTQGRPR